MHASQTSRHISASAGHIVEPKFRLTITLTETGYGAEPGTVVSWVHVLEGDEFAAKAAHIIGPANEQNLDRWTAEVLRVS